ncbi:hypothetical protein MF4836_31825 [Pseudomonas sp. MF4836]|nr:hypothetical protein MF4836_31825 [Pseudomonas sp. MF4836]
MQILQSDRVRRASSHGPRATLQRVMAVRIKGAGEQGSPWPIIAPRVHPFFDLIRMHNHGQVGLFVLYRFFRVLIGFCVNIR